MINTKSERKTGVLQILLSGLCFGFLGVFGKAAYENGLAPGEFLSMRFSIGGLILAAFLLFTRPRALRISARELVACAALGILGYAVFSSCYFQALKGLSASLTVLLLYTYPLMVAAGAWALFGERISRDRGLALPLVMVGLVSLIWGDLKVLDPRAIVFGLGSAVFYAAYILASSRWLKRTDPLVSTTYIQLAAGLALCVYEWRDPARFAEVLAHNGWLLVLTALIGSVFAMSLFLAGLQKLKNWEASVLSTSEPIMAILLAIAFLGESFTLAQIAGAGCVLGAFVIVAKPSATSTKSA